jgi:hypothetical protein
MSVFEDGSIELYSWDNCHRTWNREFGVFSVSVYPKELRLSSCTLMDQRVHVDC